MQISSYSFQASLLYNSILCRISRILAERTHGYSNSDLVALCREAAMVPIRDLSRKDIKNLASTEVRPITLRDFEVAMKAVKPSTNEQMLQKLRKYAAKTGQVD